MKQGCNDMTNLLAVPTSNHPSLSTEFPSVLAVDAGEAPCEGRPRAAAAEASASDPTTEPIRKSRAKGRKCHKKKLWIEHPNGDKEALNFRLDAVAAGGLQRVEELVVDTQA